MSPPLEEHFLGNRLHGRNGLSLEYVYTGEIFTNMRGGLSTSGATRYKGNFDLMMTADLAEMGLAPQGVFFLYANEGHGQGITDDFVGDFQGISNIDGLHSMQVTEFWYEHNFLDGAMSVRVGKQDANADFAVVDLATDFMNGSFGQHPNIPMPAWPDGAMGAALFLELNETSQFRGGVWDGASEGGNWGVSGTGDVFTMIELDKRYDFGGKPGEVFVGLWHHNGDFHNPVNPSCGGCYGFEFGAEQLLLKERSNDPEDEQGLAAFFQYGWSPESRNEVCHYFGTGLVYQGLFPRRNEDLFGLALAQAHFSDFLIDQTRETVLEAFYKMQLTPSAVVQPDLQYIVRPNGEHRDAFAFGLRFEVVL